MAIDEEYLNSLSVEDLRKELKYFMEKYYEVGHALRDTPIIPSGFVLMYFGSFGKYPEDYNKGKELQNKYGTELIPAKTECEIGAGLWYKIREGILNV